MRESNEMKGDSIRMYLTRMRLVLLSFFVYRIVWFAYSTAQHSTAHSPKSDFMLKLCSDSFVEHFDIFPLGLRMDAVERLFANIWPWCCSMANVFSISLFFQVIFKHLSEL